MNKHCKRFLTGTLLLAGGAGIFFYTSPLFFSIILISILLLIVCTELPSLFIKKPWLWLLTPLYPIFPFIIMLWMNQQEARMLLFIQFMLVASCDTGAYLIGNLYGRHKLAPQLSPGKSWEGFLGGFASCLITLIFFNWYLCNTFNTLFCLWFSTILIIFATCGDLFESFLKRKVGVKDSGFLLPGHGGLLDRFDAQMAGAVLFFTLWHYLQSKLCL